MPSPIAHTAMGCVIYHLYRSRIPRQGPERSISPVHLLLVTVGLSMLPDTDSVFGFLFDDIGKYHNNLTHSLFLGLMVALAVGSMVWLKQRYGFRRWFIIALLCYESHVLMDFITVGRGVMLFWPFSAARYQSSVKLFYGLHWSDALTSSHHFWTLVTELGFVAIIGFMTYFLFRSSHPASDQVSN